MPILRRGHAIRVRERGLGVVDGGAARGPWRVGDGKGEEIRTEEDDGGVGGVIDDSERATVVADAPHGREAWIGRVDAGDGRAAETVFGRRDVGACGHCGEDGDDFGGRGGAEEGAVGRGVGGEDGGLEVEVAEV